MTERDSRGKGGERPEERTPWALTVRVGAYLYLAGATLLVSSILLPHTQHANLPALSIVAGVAYAAGAFMLVARERISPGLLQALVAGGTLLVAAGFWVSSDNTSPYALFFIWIALYAVYFFPRRWMLAQVGLIAVAYASVLVHFRPADAIARWLIMVGTIAVAIRLVLALIGRANRRATALRRSMEENVALQERLRQAERLEAVGQLAGGVAHDFNNLLAVIINYADFVAEEFDDRENAARDLAEIRDAAERGAALTQQLLIFSRRELMRAENVDVNALVSGVERLLQRTLGEHVELVTDLADGLPPVRADRRRLEQVLLNLVVNARDAMPSGGRVEIRSANGFDPDGDREVTLTVTDNGVGMSESVARRAFEPFFTTKPPGHGTGLGLATVYGIVTQAGGTVDLRPGPGAGTTVEVRMPAAAGEPTPLPAQADGDAEELTAAGSETVLIVEDEPGVRVLARRVIDNAGYGVIEAENGEEALELFAQRSESVDLLLTDVVMPGMSGVELARRLHEQRPELPVAYMSGYSYEALARQGMTETDAPLLQKPFGADALLAAVRDALDKARGERTPVA